MLGIGAGKKHRNSSSGKITFSAAQWLSGLIVPQTQVVPVLDTACSNQKISFVTVKGPSEHDFCLTCPKFCDEYESECGIWRLIVAFETVLTFFGN